MSKFTLVPMNENHIPELANLERICFSQPWSEKSLREELDNRTAHFVVAEFNGVVVGYIGVFVVYESCDISNIAVLPEYRRQGIGRFLLEGACDIAEKCGAESVSLEVRPSNVGALALYKSVGFEEIGLRRNFYRNPTEDGLIFSKKLNNKENGEENEDFINRKFM